MSLKHDIEQHPDFWSKEIVAALEDYKNGKSEKKLRKFVDREISENYYSELIKRYRIIHLINKDKRDRERARKIKDTLCSILALVILFGSMFITAGEIVVRDGKGSALVYVVLFLWAVKYAASSKQNK